VKSDTIVSVVIWPGRVEVSVTGGSVIVVKEPEIESVIVDAGMVEVVVKSETMVSVAVMVKDSVLK
jgi:hypothetical protein